MAATNLREDSRASVIHLQSRPGDSRRAFVGRTIAAQIHAIAAVAAVFGSIVLLRLTREAPLDSYIATSVFCVSAVLLFASSAVQHFLDDGFHISKKLLVAGENLDKFSVYTLIAGTYTPVLYYSLSGWHCAALLSLVWFLALTGCLYTYYIDRLPKWMQSRVVYTAQFVALGWAVLLQIVPVFEKLAVYQSVLLVTGGLSYTLGAVAYALKKPNLGKYFGYHELWHTAVVLGCFWFYVLVASFYV